MPLGADAINPINGERIPIWIADYVLPATAPARSWPCPPTTSATSSSRSGSACPSGASSPARTMPTTRRSTRPTSPTPRATRLVNSARYSGMPCGRGLRGASSPTSRHAARARPRSPIGSATGWSAASAPGARPSRSSTARRIRLRHRARARRPAAGAAARGLRVPAAGGGNPLETTESFLRTTCPRCGGRGRRETDTMDTFVDCSWYWWRYLSPRADDGADRPRPGGELVPGRPVHRRRRARRAAPAVQPLLHQGAQRPGLVHEREPFMRLFNQGQILGADGERMSKSRGNVQDPDDLVGRYGADTVRLFLMFMGPWDQGGPWSPTGHRGRAPLPAPGLDGRARPARPRGRATRRRPLPDGEDLAAAERALRGRPIGRCRASPRTTPGSAGTRWSRS